MKYVILYFLIFSSLFGAIKEKKEFSIGVDPIWAGQTLGPLSYCVTGFTRCLLEELEHYGDVSYKLSQQPTSALMMDLEKGILDGLFSHLPMTQENLSKYDFSTPYILLGPVLIVKRENESSSLKAMKGKSVGVCPSRPFSKVQEAEGIKFKSYLTPDQALQDLALGKIEGVLLGTLEAHALVPHLYSERLRIATKPLNEDAIRLVTLKGKSKALLSPFNLGVKKLKKNGIYTRLRLEFGTI